MELLILLFLALALVILKLTLGTREVVKMRTKTVAWPLLPERTSILHIPEKEIRDLKLFFDGRILTASYKYAESAKDKTTTVLIETE